MIRWLLLALVIGLGVAIKLLPWYMSLGITVGLVLLFALAGGKFFTWAAGGIFKEKARVLDGALVEVNSVDKVEMDPAWLGLPEAERAERLDGRTFDHFYVLDVTIKPHEGRSKRFTWWEPGDLAVVPEGTPPEEADKCPADVLEVQVWQEDGFHPWEGEKYVGPLRIRLGLATMRDGGPWVFNYYLVNFGHFDLPAGPVARMQPVKSGPKPAWMTAEAGVHVPPPDALLPATANVPLFTPEAMDTEEFTLPGAKDTQPPLSIPATPPIAVGHEPERANPFRRSGTQPGAASKRFERVNTSTTYHYPCEVIFDVYGSVREKFRVPPVHGLDGDSFRAVGRHEAPERFGRNILPPNGIPDPSPEVLDRLLHANYSYRVRVYLEEPENLSFLAAALTTAASLAKEVDGVIRDAHTSLVLTYDEARRVLKSPSFAINDHVLVHTLQEPDGLAGLWLHTHGMAKFGRPDLEMRGVPDQYAPVASYGLLTVADYLSQGNVVKAGETMQLGRSFLTFTKTAPNSLEEFPTGLVRITDFDPVTQSAAVGVMRWLGEAMA